MLQTVDMRTVLLMILLGFLAPPSPATAQNAPGLVTVVNERYPGRTGLVPWAATAGLLEAQFRQTFPGSKIVSLRDTEPDTLAVRLREAVDAFPQGMPVILYLASHQNSDGSWEFARGTLSRGGVIRAVSAAVEGRQTLIFNDSCHAAAWEKAPWPEGVRCVFFGSARELNTEVDLVNDSRAVAELFVPEPRRLRQEKLPVVYSFFGVLLLRGAGIRELEKPGQWKEWVGALDLEAEKIRDAVPMRKFPALVTSGF
ncbi:MAG: hypothetical protein SFY92_11605 [Verrucomicrobiae bacterium]|nr:hypothetical protein [Verrucomicrobiae bacterium]